MLWFQEANQNQGKYFKQGNWQENFAYLIKILERGMAEGCFRQLDPFLTTLHIIGVCNLYFNAYENIKHTRPDLQLLSPEMIEATRAFYDPYLGMIIVFLSNKCMFGFPSEAGEGLAGASIKDLAEVEVTPSGEGLHWKTLDVDLSISALMNGIFGTKKWMAELARKGGSSTSFAKSEASRLNGTKGDRPGKEIVLATDEA
ncbi:MAG: DUF2442 domain-containing protein [Nostoc sp.]